MCQRLHLFASQFLSPTWDDSLTHYLLARDQWLVTSGARVPTALPLTEQRSYSTSMTTLHSKFVCAFRLLSETLACATYTAQTNVGVMQKERDPTMCQSSQHEQRFSCGGVIYDAGQVVRRQPCAPFRFGRRGNCTPSSLNRPVR